MGQIDTQMDDLLGPPAAAWPKTLGIFSIVLGSLGVLANGCGSCFMLAGPSFLVSMMQNMPKDRPAPPGQNPQAAIDTMTLMQPWMLAQGVVILVTLGTSVWLLIAGIQMVMRKPVSVPSHKAWAWVRMGLAAVMLVLGVVSTLLTAARQAEISQTYGGSDTAQGVMIKGLAFGFIGFVLIMIYPVVVLVVLSKPWAKSEVARWGTDRAAEADAFAERP